MNRVLALLILGIEIAAALFLAWLSGDFVGSFLWWLAAIISLTVVDWWFRGRRRERLPKTVQRIPEDRTY